MKKRFDIFIIGVLFPIAVTLSWVDFFVGFHFVEKRNENRSRAEMPAAPKDRESVKKYWEQFELYFKDEFGLRDSLVLLNSWVRLKVFNSSPTDEIIKGKEDWYFLARQSNVELYRNLLPYSEEDLKKSVETLLARKDWADSNGIYYFFTVGPDSHTLNPEKLPKWINKVGAQSRLEQLLEAAAKAGVPVLDLRKAILNAKQIGPVSFKTDTHWTGFGAYIAYREVVEHLKGAGLAVGDPIPMEEYKWSDLNAEGLDLAIIAGLQDSMREVSRSFDYAGKRRFEVLDRKSLHFSTKNRGGSAFNVSCLCDSMAGNIFPHLAYHFRNVRVMWGYLFDAEEMLKYKTNIILDLVIERMLGWRPLENPPGFGK